MRLEKNPLHDYFKKAHTWADDHIARITISRNRYQIAFLVTLSLSTILSIAICLLMPLKTLIPMVIHHYDNGVITVESLSPSNAPLNQAQVESDIARYITNRESYDIHSYRAQFDLVSLLSSSSVHEEYLRSQDKNAVDAPIHILGVSGYRSVHLYSINFLDTLLSNEHDTPKNHHNVAEVVFTTTDIDKATGREETKHYNALISWQYTKPTNAPEIRWQNWDGFQVIRYTKNLRNV